MQGDSLAAQGKELLRRKMAGEDVEGEYQEWEDKFFRNLRNTDEFGLIAVSLRDKIVTEADKGLYLGVCALLVLRATFQHDPEAAHIVFSDLNAGLKLFVDSLTGGLTNPEVVSKL